MKTRRPEFKRARKAKWRKNKRMPAERMFRAVLKGMCDGLRTAMFPTVTPFLACLERKGEGAAVRWGGNGHYWDVVTKSP